MKPADLRNATWREVLTHVTEDMVKVHLAWQAHGPGTTRDVAQRSGISLLTFRPRTTDLYKVGLVVLVDSEKSNGVYAFRSREDAEVSRAWQERADFRRKAGDEPEPTASGFTTVEQAVASMPPAEQVALAARIMGRWAHLGKKREARGGADQLNLLPA